MSTLAALMDQSGVHDCPAWFSGIDLKFWPMDHQLDQIKRYPRFMRFLDASEPGTGKTYPAQTHAILMAALGNKVCFTMPPKLIGQFYAEFFDFFNGVGNHLKIEHLDCTAAQKVKKEKRWDAEGWPDILILSYDVYRQYNDKNFKKKIGSNQWRRKLTWADGRVEYPPYFKDDGTAHNDQAQPYTMDGREISKKTGKADNHKRLLLKEKGYNVWFFDEGHALCGMDSILSQSVAETAKELGDEVAIYLMTGTPVPTKLHDVYGILRLINPDAYLNKAAFVRQHCIVARQKINTGKKIIERDDIIGYQDTEKVYEALWKNAVRVQKRDVLQDMPEPLISEVRVKLSGAHRKLYKQVISDHFAVLGDKVLAPDNQSALRHMALQLISCPGQFAPDTDEGEELDRENELTKTTDDLIETIQPNAKRKVIIFAYYRRAIDMLKKRYAQYNPGAVYGDNAASKEDIQRFLHDDDCSMLIIQWQAGGAGLNLQIASYLIYYEIPTSPKDAQQTIARADRKGQKNLVNVYFMRVLHTLSDRNMRNLLKNEESNNRIIKDRTGLLHQLLGAA